MFQSFLSNKSTGELGGSRGARAPIEVTVRQHCRVGIADSIPDPSTLARIPD
jgi:hypothetical protein